MPLEIGGRAEKIHDGEVAGRKVQIKGTQKVDDRDYTVVLYNQGAQEFILKNMEAILNGEVVKEED